MRESSSSSSPQQKAGSPSEAQSCAGGQMVIGPPREASSWGGRWSLGCGGGSLERRFIHEGTKFLAPSCHVC